MADIIPDPGLSFDEALVLDAAIKLSADLDARFKDDAVLDAAKQKLWRAAMKLHGDDPSVYSKAIERFKMQKRFQGE